MTWNRWRVVLAVAAETIIATALVYSLAVNVVHLIDYAATRSWFKSGPLIDHLVAALPAASALLGIAVALVGGWTWSRDATWAWIWWYLLGVAVNLAGHAVAFRIVDAAQGQP
ncbi:hypothetical protein [Plantactinospora sp. CA-290183]|uniref:hypothetical protein n=1 Tax=Plantactinospora sp. CA-290183 TaxID=3240006 RepID=UPI003D89E2EB